MKPETTRSLLLLGGGLIVLISIFVGGIYLIPRYLAANPYGLQRSDAHEVDPDDMYLDVTPVLPGMAKKMNLSRYVDKKDYQNKFPFLVALNTHTGNIRDVRLNEGSKITLRGPDGQTYPPLEDPLAVSSHHNTYLLYFPSRDMEGNKLYKQEEGNLILRVAGLGNHSVRTFSWYLPLKTISTSNFTLTQWLMLAVAMCGAMLVVLSPCALELTIYYSGIVGAVLSEQGESFEQESAPMKQLNNFGRWKLLRNLIAFTVGFTLLYAISGALVGLIGDGIKNPLGEYGEWFALFGGSIIILFSLKLMGFINMSYLRHLSRWIRNGLRSVFLPGSFKQEEGKPVQPDQVNVSDSFLAGIGLSSGCLSCMSGAVLYPLLIYAGIASWYWGFVTLGVYSLLIALPMMLITLGGWSWMNTLSHRKTISKYLKYISGSMLLVVGILIFTGQDRIITDVFFNGIGQFVRTMG
ncbi:MAG: cytochrome c biogenesis CcdA family protein [bacterium]